MRYYGELKVLDISIVSYRIEMTTPLARSILTVRNDDRVRRHFGPVRLERMTGAISRELDDLQVSVMTSQCDTDVCVQID